MRMDLHDKEMWRQQIKEDTVWENFVSAHYRIRYGERHKNYNRKHDNGVDDYISKGIVSQSKFTYWDTNIKQDKAKYIFSQLVKNKEKSSIESAWKWASDYDSLDSLKRYTVVTNLDLTNSKVKLLSDLIKGEFNRLNVRVEEVQILTFTDLATELEQDKYFSLRARYLEETPPAFLDNNEMQIYLDLKEGIGINYKLPIVGRKKDLKKLSANIISGSVILHATQGMGKTKMAKEWSRENKDKYDIFWLWDSAEDNLTNEFRKLPKNTAKDRIFIVDRAEANINSFNSLLSAIEHPSNKNNDKILCITRTSSLSKIKEIFYQYNQTYPTEIRLNLLSKKAMDILLKSLNYNATDRRAVINILSKYPPLYSYILAEGLKSKHFPELLREENIKSLISQAVSSLQDREKLFATYLSFLQPMRWNETTEKYICEQMNITEIELSETLTSLENKGYVHRAGNKISLLPDLLGQEILTDFYAKHKETGGFKKIRDKLIVLETKNVLSNLALADNVGGTNNLLGDWLNQLKNDIPRVGNVERSKILHNVKDTIGYVKPEVAQELAFSIINTPKKREKSFGIYISHKSLLRDLREIVIDSMQTPKLIKSGMNLLVDMGAEDKENSLVEFCGQKGGRDFWHDSEAGKLYYVKTSHEAILEELGEWIHGENMKRKKVALHILVNILQIDVTHSYSDPLNPMKFNIQQITLKIRQLENLIQVRNKSWDLLLEGMRDGDKSIRVLAIESIRNSLDSFYRYHKSDSNKRFTRIEMGILKKIQKNTELLLSEETDLEIKKSLEELITVYNEHRRGKHRISEEIFNKDCEYVVYRELFGSSRFFYQEAMPTSTLTRYIVKNLTPEQFMKIIEYKHKLNKLVVDTYGKAYSLCFHISQIYPNYGEELRALLKKSKILVEAGYPGNIYAGLISSSIKKSKSIKKHIRRSGIKEEKAGLLCYLTLDISKINKEDIDIFEEYLKKGDRKYHNVLALVLVKLIDLDPDRIWGNIRQLVNIGNQETVLTICKELYFSNRSFTTFDDEKLWYILEHFPAEKGMKGQEGYPLEKLLEYMTPKSSFRVLKAMENIIPSLPYGTNKALSNIKNSPDLQKSVELLLSWSTGKEFKKAYIAKDILSEIIDDKKTGSIIRKLIKKARALDEIRALSSFISSSNTKINGDTLDLVDALIITSKGDKETINSLYSILFRGYSGTVGIPPKEMLDIEEILKSRLSENTHPYLKEFYTNAINMVTKQSEDWVKRKELLEV